MKRRISSTLMALVLCLTLLPAAAYADGGTAVYVSSSGNDGTGDGSADKPFATLAKAVDAADDGATVYVMSDLTMTDCARFYSKSLTITSGEGGPYTVTRDNSFTTQSDHARSWYNPAMIEVQTHTGGEGAGLTLTNIIFDDARKHEGTVFAQASSGKSEGDESNKIYVQDAIIASNGNGWADPFATFWVQRNGAAELMIDGLTLDSALPQIVYALVQETGADGKPVSGAEVRVYSTKITDDGIRLTLPNGYTNGCAVALAQPTKYFGKVVITTTKPELKETADLSGGAYEVPYTATYTMSDSLLSMLQHALYGVPMTFVVELDSRLTAKKDAAADKFLYTFDGDGVLNVDESQITVSADGHTIRVVCTPVDNWQKALEGKTSVVMKLDGTGVLAATGFDAGKYLNTTGHIEGTIGSLPIMIPANVCRTKMTAQTYTVTYDANGGSGTMTDKKSPYADGAVATVLTNGFTRSRYTFTGWNTEPDGSGKSYAEGVSIKMLGNVVLYAQWSKNSSHDDDDDKYFFAIQKLDAQDGHALNDAKFELYQRDNRDNKLPASRKTTAHWGTESGIALFSVSATQTRDGGSTWYYREITAPEGYVLDSTEHKIKATNFSDSRSTAVQNAVTVRNYRGTTPDLLNDSDHFAYVIGYMDGNVRPYGLISRAETTTIFFRLLKDSVRDGNLLTSNTYTDVADDYWANTAISTMTGLGIVQGRSTTTFDPKAPITRAQFAAICARFDTGKSSGEQTFSDIQGHWAEKYIQRAAELGWIKGFEDGTFRPDTYITRAQAMTMINRVLNRIPEDESDLLPGMNVWPDCNPGDWFYLAVQEATNSHDFEHKAGNYETWTKLMKNPDWTRYEN
ncbi:S-layer homology domain-containing protein [Oscillibacter valericigenes]|nr:S-layer homology domain-containing protein [Oscillibacter valericigenes]